MNHPMFLHWMQTHNHRVRKDRAYKAINSCNADPAVVTPFCTACTLKYIVNVYWGNTTVNVLLPFTQPYHRPNEVISRLENIIIGTGMFIRDEQDCARQFYDMLLQRVDLFNL
jgi:hypothetical protein